MLTLSGSKSLKKIVVLNPKGGSGKTTLAFGIAGYLAATNRSVALLDMDKQGSSGRWLHNRAAELPRIEGLSSPAGDSGVVAVPPGVDFVVVDAPGGLDGDELIDYTCGAHAILVPVLPSDFDIHAASRLVSDLLLKAQVSRRNGRLGIVANRVRERTIAYRRLIAFLERLSIRLVGVLRDSQNYTHAAVEGRCLHEMATSRVSKDMGQWERITAWLEDRLETPLTARDWLRPAAPAQEKRNRRRAAIPLAAAVATVAIVGWYVSSGDSGRPQPEFQQAVVPVDAESRPVDSSPVAVAVRHSTPLAIVDEARMPEPGTQMQEAGAPVDAGHEEARWQLTGVVQSNGERLLLLYDRQREEGVMLRIDDDVDGWTVAESGSDFAVLQNEERVVRLALNEAAMP